MHIRVLPFFTSDLEKLFYSMTTVYIFSILFWEKKKYNIFCCFTGLYYLLNCKINFFTFWNPLCYYLETIWSKWGFGYFNIYLKNDSTLITVIVTTMRHEDTHGQKGQEWIFQVTGSAQNCLGESHSTQPLSVELASI